jgi:hypothetical protein
VRFSLQRRKPGRCGETWTATLRYARAVALGATIHRLKLQLSDTDRTVYETLDLRLAQHPSETAPY